ncbi:ABC transporter ATP-binding protein [Massilia antarctica]|uniref:ABC transporter ATP-binding protein n=1 Tax=Massilia antarctica TaxID=2765360 RepID=UPI0006BB6F86|nr:ATP-binding cassette domain-containing protein [Massilia sp. H27-R4]MCY0916390.1 ATP-binding cassette domain-containing protein [Massilia sp. H27-R4]CUI07357.1 ABC-type Na+ transport system, ATPase component [Janthinobacterium sp. CG23_2]CUU31143.1 ABC-type Na+ transport system, ATPase component [Janthinobacterium sp. CG23_2]
MIVVNDVRKQFGSLQALGGVSFTAADGHITALLGPNGAGKTTLLRLLVGLLKRDQGSISIGGIDPALNSMAVRKDIGFLTDQFGLYERLNTREYLAYFGELNGMSMAVVQRRIDEVADLLAMQDILERRAKGFSQGQRIKVALARTLLHKPRHLLLDEPSRGLDVMSTRALRSALTALRHEGCCVIMATHVMQEVTHLCDDVIVIAKGHTVAQGSPQELCRRTGIANLEDAFVSLVGEEGIAA